MRLRVVAGTVVSYFGREVIPRNLEIDRRATKNHIVTKDVVALAKVRIALWGVAMIKYFD